MKESLMKIDQALENNYAEVFKSLRPGATNDELKLLSKCFSNNGIPDEIVALYKWHNGQAGSSSLNQNDNRTFLPINEVIDAWEFLNDPMEDILEPISRSWVPILYNGAGDYIMYVTEGDNKGKLISYWHDDESRNVVFESLGRWVKDVLNAARA